MQHGSWNAGFRYRTHTSKIVAAIILASSSVDIHAEVLYRYTGGVLFDGRYGPVARVQEKARNLLAVCGQPATITADGKFGAGTRDALAALAKCPTFAVRLAEDDEAKKGALTTGYWEALFNLAPPSVDDRARTLMLTYEATDYTRMEWNFCQSSPVYDPGLGNRICYSNDPRSYLTWGPNGATGGGGHEVQLILQAVDSVNPMLIDESFGPERYAVRRLFRMRDQDPSRSLETYLCGVWADRARRSEWKAGFESLGRIPIVR